MDWDFQMWLLAALTGWPRKQGFVIRKSVGASPGQKKVTVITWWP